MVERITTQKNEDVTTTIWKFKESSISIGYNGVDGKVKSRTTYKVHDSVMATISK